MNKSTFECTVQVFRSSVEVKVEIPRTLTVTEVLNYLEFSQKLTFPKNSFIMVKRDQNLYSIPDEKRDLTVYQQNSLSLLIYPPNLLLKIHCPDKRINVRQFDSKLPAAKIVETLCNDIFHLQSPESYALYQCFNVTSDAFPPNEPLIAYIPEIQDVWLLRRFWIRALTNFTEENDVHFCYTQAKVEFYNDKFPYQQVDHKTLLTLSIIVEFDGKQQEAVKFLSKASKKDLKKFFPKFAVDDKKLIKQVLEMIPQFPSNVLVAKTMFLQKVLEFPYFGSATFPAIFEHDGAKYNGRISFAEEGVCFFENDTSYKSILTIPYSILIKYKAISNSAIRFKYQCSDEVKTLEFQTPASAKIPEHLLILLNFLKQNKLKEKEELNKKKGSKMHRRNTVRTSVTSFTDLLSSDSSLIKNSPIEAEVNVTLEAIKLPEPQTPVTFTIPRATRTKMNTEFHDSVKTPEIPSSPTNLDYGISKSICSLLKKTIAKECLAPLTEAETLVYSFGGSRVAIDVIEGCDGGFNQIIATISRVGSILAHEILDPLDAFSCLNYVRSITQSYINSQLKTFDLTGPAQNVGPLFSRVAITLKNQSDKRDWLLAYVVLGAYDDDTARELHALIDSSCAALMFCTIAIARAFVKAGVITDELIYLLENIPKTVSFDPIYATKLCDVLNPLATSLKITEKAHTFLSQSHEADIEVRMIKSVVDHLTQFLNYIKSPASLFLLSQSMRCFKEFAYPDSLSEASDVYQGSLESAFVYWCANDATNAELSLRIQDTVKTFISLFTSGGSNSMSAKDLFDQLNLLMARGFNDETMLEQFLDSTDPLHSIVISLLDNEKIEESIPLLAIDSLSPDQKRSAFDEAYKAIDSCLRSTAVKPSVIDGVRISTHYSLLSTVAISTSRDNDKINDVKIMIGDLGSSLIDLIKETPEERAANINDIRIQFRKLSFMVNDPENGCQKIASGTAKYEMSFIFERPNLENQINSLRQICAELSLFSLKAKKN